MARAIVTAALAACVLLGAAHPARAQSMVRQPMAPGGSVLIQIPLFLVNGIPVFQIVPVTNQLILIRNGQILVAGSDCPARVIRIGNIPVLVPGDCSLPAVVADLDPSIQILRVRAAAFRDVSGATGPTDVSRYRFVGHDFAYTATTLLLGGSLMVPLEETLTTLGARLNYESGQPQATFRYGGREVILWLNTLFARVGDQAWILERPTVMYEGRLYVPASFVEDLEPAYRIPRE